MSIFILELFPIIKNRETLSQDSILMFLDYSDYFTTNNI